MYPCLSEVCVSKKMVKAMRGVIPEGEVCYYVGILRPPVVAVYHVGSEFV